MLSGDAQIYLWILPILEGSADPGVELLRLRSHYHHCRRIQGKVVKGERPSEGLSGIGRFEFGIVHHDKMPGI